MNDDKKPFHNPFAALREKLQDLPAGPAPQPAKAKVGPARAVVRMERKGRRGKEVTVIEQLDLNPADLEGWLKALKGALGCGGALEGETLVLQGDQRKRLQELLTSRGVRKVTIG
jgi:translation initiation factor 1